MTQVEVEKAIVLRPSAGNVPISELPPAGHYIDGAFVAGSSHTATEVTNPSTEQVLAKVPEGTSEDVDLAVAAAARAQESWGNTSPTERSEVLALIADILEANKEVLAVLESANTGKPAGAAEDDVARAVDAFRSMAGEVRSLTALASDVHVAGHTSVLMREPVGVVGVMVPWNYPLLMAACKIAPILAAGNTVVLKPSAQTPLSVLKLAELVSRHVPDGILNIVTGSGRVVGRRVAEHPDVALIALTDSVRSSETVAETPAHASTRVRPEFGGHAPVVVFPDADLKAAAAGVRAAGFRNSGQDCGAARRVLVHESVAEEFTKHLVDGVNDLVVGAPGAGEEVAIGPMISREHYERALELLGEAAEAGIEVAAGGAACEGPGYFIQPTVLINVPAGARVARHDFFGPVVTVESFSGTDEAVSRANETPHGFSASIWTKDSALSLSVPKRLAFGTVWVNPRLPPANRRPGAATRARDAAWPHRSMRSRTFPAPSTSCSTTATNQTHKTRQAVFPPFDGINPIKPK